MEVELPEPCEVGPDEGGHPQQPACTEPPGAAMDLPGWAPLLGSTYTLAFSAFWSPFPGGGGMIRLRVEGEIGHSMGPWLPCSKPAKMAFPPHCAQRANQECPLCVPSAPSPTVGLVTLSSCSSASPVRWWEPSALLVGPRASLTPQLSVSILLEGTRSPSVGEKPPQGHISLVCLCITWASTWDAIGLDEACGMNDWQQTAKMEVGGAALLLNRGDCGHRPQIPTQAWRPPNFF